VSTYVFQPLFLVIESLNDDIIATDLSAESLTTLILSINNFAWIKAELSLHVIGFFNNKLLCTPSKRKALLEEAAIS
jgi:hypothetical protein